MKNVSTVFKNELYRGNRNYIKTARVTLQNGTILELDNSNFWNNGITVDGAVSSNGSFDIGAVIIGQLTLVISNIEDEFSDYDFTNAKIDNIKVGLKLPDDTIESLSYGVYTVNEASYNGSIITLTAYDNMYKFDRPYSESTILYPATLGEIVRDACSVCGVTLQSVTFDGDDFEVANRPEDDAITFRNILQWVAQIAGKYCTIDVNGRLVLGWYNTDVLDNIHHLDGGRFEPWDEDDVVSGGTFSPWTSGSAFNAGTFQECREYHHLYSWNSLTLTLDDVVITGVKVTEEVDGEDGKETVSYQSGTDGYVIKIEGNKLIQGTSQTVAGLIGAKVIGMRFRPFSGSVLSNPMMEPGDIAILTDRKGNTYNTVITSTVFQPGAFQNISCEAEAPIRNSANRYSQATQAYVEARKEIEKEKTDREKAIDELTDKINNSSGIFTTIETQADGSNIYYLHDKPLLDESMIVWKMTAEAWGVSTDGGKTWNAGMTVDGDTIVRILSAVGINADWIKAGTLTLGGANNTNGNIIILSSSGTEIGRWNRNGFSTTGRYFTVDSLGRALTSIFHCTKLRIAAIPTSDILDADTILETYSTAILMAAYSSGAGETGNYMYIGRSVDDDPREIYGIRMGKENVTKGLDFYGDALFHGNLRVTGTKNRLVCTDAFGKRLLYSYETTSPMFGDIGTAITDENGECFISIDDIFYESIDSEIEYQVFLQKEGTGDIWVEDKKSTYFHVKGSPHLKFSWEIKAKQKDYEYNRLEIDEIEDKAVGVENLLSTRNIEKLEEILYEAD